MMSEERHIDLFERYRSNELSESELKDFEARLAYDTEFKIAFEEYVSVEEGIKNHFRNELKSKLMKVDDQMDEVPKKSNVFKLLIWSSSVAAAIIIGIFIFQHFSQPDYQQLAQDYWPHEEGLPVKMSNKGKYDDAMNAFKLEDWEKAEELLKYMESDTSSYFLGVIAYENQNYQHSADYFWQVEKNSRYYDDAQFRLALVSLINGDKNLAKLILQEQVQHQTEFAAISLEILEKLQ